MKCADCLGLGYNPWLGLGGRIHICSTCNGVGQIRPPYTLLYDPKKDLVERYDREVR
jgi:hypothetical protein